MARKRRKRKESKVELNLAAMLDMAFQLLAFFILTFKPLPTEGQIQLKLPPPQAVTQIKNAQTAGNEADNNNPVAGINSLIVSVIPTPAGDIGSLAIGEGSIGNLGQLESRLKTILGDKSNPFEQVLIQVGPQLRYEELMKVIDVCTRQKMANGEKLSKLSFVELASAGDKAKP